MSERHAVLCCALLSLSLVLGPAAGLVRAAGTNGHDVQSPTAVVREATQRYAASLSDGDLPKRKSAPTVSPTPAVAETVAPGGEPATAPEPPVAVPPPAEPTTAPEPAAPPAPPPSLLDRNQVIVFYGTPLSSGMGILGMFPPDEAASRLKQEAAYYDELNGDERGATPAMDLIYSMVQAEPTGNGLFLSYLPDDKVRQYLDIAERDDLQLILDLQIGRGDVLDEVKKIEPYLKNPRVHVAIDPEYAVGAQGVPIFTPGRVSGEQINAVQAYLSQLTRDNDLPPKLLVVHQYIEDTVENGDVVHPEPGVDLVLNMDGIGEARDKVEKYQHFASRSYAEHKGFNIFLNHDYAPMSEQDVLRLKPFPDLVFYQ